MARKLLHGAVIFIFFFMVIFLKIEELGLKMAFANALLIVGLMTFIFYAHGRLLVNTFFESKRYIPFTLGTIAFLATVILFRIKVEIPFFAAFYSRFETEYLPFMYLIIILMPSLVLAFSTLVHLLENRFEKERKAQLFIQEHQAAQLQFLKAQINPHFLFNTLNNIYSLSIVQSPKTPQMVLQLSQLLRYVIYESQNKKVNLTGELTQIERFIALFQLKNKNPVNIQFEKTGNFDGQKIEPMILIPLVENTFKHCDFNRNKKAYAKIKAKIEGDYFSFYTINSKNENDQQKDKVGGVGLQNISKRLALNYPKQHHIEINNLPYSFEVSLRIALSSNTTK